MNPEGDMWQLGVTVTSMLYGRPVVELIQASNSYLETTT